jgi:hypothetical protein
MNNKEHEQHLQNAEQARLGLAADMHDINQVGERIIQRGKRTLKNSTLALGAAAVGGLVIGITVGRASTGRRTNSLVGELLGRATSAFATSLATQLLTMLVTKRSGKLI